MEEKVASCLLVICINSQKLSYRDFSHCHQIDLIPLYKLGHLVIKIDFVQTK